MKKIANILGIAFLLLSQARCTSGSSVKNNFLYINGRIKNLPDGKVYLAEAHRWNIPLDSTESHNGQFTFKILNDSSFIPYMASISFFDSNTLSKSLPLLFLNYIKSGLDTPTYLFSGFYLEKGGEINIVGDKKQKVRIYGSKETDIMYRFNGDFGYIGGGIDSIKRTRTLMYYRNRIKEYPYSYFLLKSIYENKEQYSSDEMEDIYSLFDENLQNSILGNKINRYIKLSSNYTEPYRDLRLLNIENKYVNLIEANTKLNMLIFWASWCGPCRMEIPQIKEIYNNYKSLGLTITSVSIDEDTAQWRKAMNEEKMPWNQLIIKNSKTTTIDEIKSMFRFSSIPLVCFVNNEGKMVDKIIGYAEDNKEKYQNVILKYLKN